jgi:hypothetical protein
MATFTNVGILELKNKPIDYSCIDLNLFLLFHAPKTHVMWVNFEDCLKKLEKVVVKPEITPTPQLYGNKVYFLS